jgi:putative oxidoreductase
VKRLLAVPAHPTFVDGALLLLRVIAGAAFMFHGWMKIQNPFGWMGPEGFAPAPFQALAAMSEFGGGLGWILGLLTPIASLGILCTMMVAMFTHLILRGDPFVSATGGPAAELASVYFAIALLLIALGPGRYSLDRAIFGNR